MAMEINRPCVFCWTPALHTRPDEFYQLQQRVACPTCGPYRLGESAHQSIWEKLDSAEVAKRTTSPFPPEFSRLIRERVAQSGGKEFVILDWDTFRAEVRESGGESGS
jgi:hypothetical protein